MKKVFGNIARRVFNADPNRESHWLTTTSGDWASLFGWQSASGQTVSTEKTLAISTAWACITKTASVIASMPIDIFEKQSDGNLVRVVDHELEGLLNLRPNQGDTGFEFWSQSSGFCLTNGNAYAKKTTLGQRVVDLTPIPNCRPFRTTDGVLKYRFFENGHTHELPREEVFHLRTFKLGGDVGMSVIRHGVNSLGSAISAEESAGSFFKNQMGISGVLTTEHTLSPEQRTRLQAMLEAYTGSDKVGKIAALEAGMKFVPMQINPEDAQLLETRQFNVEEICRWFGMPPIIIGHASTGQTMWGSGVEQVMLSWLTTGIDPILENFEQRIARDLMSLDQQRRFEARFRREKILRMDSAAMAEWSSKLVQAGVLKPNEGRRFINLPPDDYGDELLVQGAMIPLRVAQQQEQANAEN